MSAALEPRVHAWLDRQVEPAGTLGLACSGGSDSTALLLMAASWAKARGRRLHILTLDHGLRRESASEVLRVAARAKALGLPCEILSWSGDKPERGLQAAARQARHTLLARACRSQGIRQLLLGHTQDDQAETVWMRLEAGGHWRGCSGMAPVAPSPLWPAGRDLQLLRPLLALRRTKLRDWLTRRGEGWLDDPSNQDEAYARIRIRRHLERLEGAGFPTCRLAALADDLRQVQAQEDWAAAVLARSCIRIEAWGGARIDAHRLSMAPPALRYRIWEALSLALSGQSGLPDRRALDRLDAALLATGRVTAAGVLLDVSARGVWMVRDPGPVLGRVDRPAPELMSQHGDDPVWDGRFALSSVPASVSPGVLGRDYSGLPERDVLSAIPGFARPGLLALRRAGRVVALPGLDDRTAEGGIAEPLFLHRFCTRLLPGQRPVWFDTSESLQPLLQ
ncbi:MAG: tRNA lysidine(34) synthetase TilS [Maricaulis sp.]|nr:tRNA lysidine(34) synthetase TilS [Maricaulis sp.]